MLMALRVIKLCGSAILLPKSSYYSHERRHETCTQYAKHWALSMHWSLPILDLLVPLSVPPKAVGPTTRFGSEFPSNLLLSRNCKSIEVTTMKWNKFSSYNLLLVYLIAALITLKPTSIGRRDRVSRSHASTMLSIVSFLKYLPPKQKQMPIPNAPPIHANAANKQINK